MLSRKLTHSVIIQIKAIEKYFSVNGVYYVLQCNVVLAFESMDESLCLTINMKAIEKYSHKATVFHSVQADYNL